MTLSPQDWHRRFTQQARWTAHLRAYLYNQIEIEKASRVLEVGCGTGAILSGLPPAIPTRVGLDIDAQNLGMAMRTSPRAALLQADAHLLPYPRACFDFSFCHFLLLWVADPIRVIQEMLRVTRPGGAVLVLAEPDYGGRIDFPPELTQLGRWQMHSLQEQGADPLMGRKLGRILQHTRLESVETGVLGGQWSEITNWDQWGSEWELLESDFNKTSQVPGILHISELKAIDRAAYQRGERVLFVPTFYGWGRVPSSSK